MMTWYVAYYEVMLFLPTGGCLQIRDVLQSRWSLLNHYTLVWCYTSHNFFYAISLRGQKEMFSNNAEDY